MLTQTLHTAIIPTLDTPIANLDPLDFHLPASLEADRPPEAKNMARDDVRLMVSYRASDRVEHTAFRNLAEFLDPGDVVVINTSGTLKAALEVTRSDGTPLELHLSTRLPAELWIVEVRRPDETATKPFHGAVPGETLSLPGNATATLHTPYRSDQRHDKDEPIRLWIATLDLSEPVISYLDRYGKPIRYGYVPREWPLEYYQTVYATEPGSAEMPSAGRAFTPEVITRLISRGVHVVPLILHTGVASLEDHEPPYEEYYRVPLDTARQINLAAASGNRVIAVGTTVVRALETVVDKNGIVHPGEGWTHLVITPNRPLRAVNALLTGLHEPKATHLSMLEALAGRSHLETTYTEALEERYLWHEFGDLHLILP
ncbi:MAG: S-adenosylmethionine:tRNA ribosyltransferase-isomerase [bacterium]|nr:S-adenosylmethionine:tRNA ribosyltransferase-isomerase [bacterium]